MRNNCYRFDPQIVKIRYNMRVGGLMQINDWTLKLDADFTNFIENEYATKKMTPAYDKLYYALELTALADVKVVIFGQDPYPQAGVATGLAFSANNTLPASLRNIFTELESDLAIKRTNPDLSDWAQKGVLLLNTSLCVEVGNANSHSKCGWMDVTKQIIEQINQKRSGVVFVLLGNNAHKLAKYISDEQSIMCFTHPSPLSAYRGFWGSKPFSAINKQLKINGYSEIDFADDSK